MKKRIVKVLKHCVCIILCLIVIMPFILVLVNSFKTKSEAAKMSLSLPTEWHFQNYLDVIEDAKLGTGFLNSLIYAGTATFLGVLCCAMAAFVLARNKTKLNTFLYYFLICGLFFPVNYVTLIKVFQTFHLINTRAGIVIAFISAMTPFCVFIIKSFVASVPVELDEAAVIDGCGPVRLFFLVIAPLIKPTLITCFILQFMSVWSNFLTPLYLSSSSRLYPMTISVYQFFGKNQSWWHYVFADIVLTCIPVIIVYLIGQKYIIGGLVTGSVKG